MKLVKYKTVKKGRRYVSWIFRLSPDERLKLRKGPSRYRIADVDSNGTIFVEPLNASTTTDSQEFLRKSRVTSFRFHGSEEEYARFKQLCKSHGLTTCRVLSDFVRACLVKEGSLLEPGSITIESHFYGRPRGPSEKIYG